MNEWMKTEIDALIEQSKDSLSCSKQVIRESDKLHYLLESIAESLLAKAMIVKEMMTDEQLP